jgi:hypothetical protein
MRRAEDAGNVVVLQILSELLTHSFFKANEYSVLHGSISVSVPGSIGMRGTDL